MSDNIAFRMTSPQDVTLAIPLIFSSGPNTFRYVFCSKDPQQAERYLADVFIGLDTEFSHRVHLGMYLDDELVALGCIKTASQNIGFMWAALKSIFRHFSWLEGVGIIWRGLKTETIICPPNKRAAILCDLGVSTSKRGLGLGSKLIAALESRALAMGYNVVELDVAEDNPQAHALYLRLGYQDQHHNQSSLRNSFGFVPSHTRMAKTLS